MIVGHVESPFDSEPPLAAEVPFEPSLRVSRHERHEIVAFSDLTPDLLIPCLSAAQFAFVVPDFEAKTGQRIPQPSRSLAILGRIAEKYRRSRSRCICGGKISQS